MSSGVHDPQSTCAFDDRDGYVRCREEGNQDRIGECGDESVGGRTHVPRLAERSHVRDFRREE